MDELVVNEVFAKVGKKYSDQLKEWDDNFCTHCFEAQKSATHDCPNTKKSLSEMLYSQAQKVSPSFSKAQQLWVLQRCLDSLLNNHLVKATQQQGTQKVKSAVKKHQKSKKSKKS